MYLDTTSYCVPNTYFSKIGFYRSSVKIEPLLAAVKYLNKTIKKQPKTDFLAVFSDYRSIGKFFEKIRCPQDAPYFFTYRNINRRKPSQV